MGIKGLNTWIHASFPGVMRPVDGRGATYDHVLFDLNGIVHQACRRCPKEKEVLRTIIRELDELLRLFPARRTVLIALDGPGPEAKLLEQRKRRIDKVLKAARDLEAAIPGSAEALRREELRRVEAAAGRGQRDAPKRNGRKKRVGFDSLQVTPGTLFMLRLRHALEWYAASRLCGVAGVCATTPRPAIFVSGADVAGEGELKLLQHLRQLGAAGEAQSALLVGPDADLLLLALAARPEHAAAPVDVLTTDAEGRRKLFLVAQLAAHLGRQCGASQGGAARARPASSSHTAAAASSSAPASLGAAPERRLAEDGEAYTLAEFIAFYGGRSGSARERAEAAAAAAEAAAAAAAGSVRVGAPTR